MSNQKRDSMGEKVDAHCPYDEATLRVDKFYPGKLICPCCWTTFDPPGSALIAKEGQ